MVSEFKSATARANGAKSKGPKSAATREISSRNSIRHGQILPNKSSARLPQPVTAENAERKVTE